MSNDESRKESSERDDVDVDDDGNGDVKEIKISEVKDKLIKQQNEELAMNKKDRKKKSKKKRNKESLFDRYKQENEKDKLNEDEIQSVPLLLSQKKVRNVLAADKEMNARKKIYTKNAKRLVIEEDDQSEEFDPVKANIIEFKTNHFFGNRIERSKNFTTKI